jgi:hypothetical protein
MLIFIAVTTYSLNCQHSILILLPVPRQMPAMDNALCRITGFNGGLGSLAAVLSMAVNSVVMMESCL